MMLSDVCRASVAYIGPKSRTERPMKTKIGTEVAHVTRDWDTTIKVKRSKVKVTRPLYSQPCWRVRQLQRWGILWQPPGQLVLLLLFFPLDFIQKVLYGFRWFFCEWMYGFLGEENRLAIEKDSVSVLAHNERLNTFRCELTDNPTNWKHITTRLFYRASSSAGIQNTILFYHVCLSVCLSVTLWYASVTHSFTSVVYN